jgi:hypothetical protein
MTSQEPASVSPNNNHNDHVSYDEQHSIAEITMFEHILMKKTSVRRNHDIVRYLSFSDIHGQSRVLVLSKRNYVDSIVNACTEMIGNGEFTQRYVRSVLTRLCCHYHTLSHHGSSKKECRFYRYLSNIYEKSSLKI